MSKEFIHYYVGQPCTYDDPYHNQFGLSGKVTPRIIMQVRDPHLSGAVRNVKPHLRKLEDMTEEEAKGFLLIVQGAEAKYKSHNETAVFYSKPGVWAGDSWFIYNAPEAFHYLLQLGFDLFGLVDAGLAIDAKTITHHQ